MAGKLSFSIAINLLTENFKRGTSSVKNGLRAMQMQVLTFAAALGAGGIGLSGFITQLITVARETSRVTTALKNVSGGMGQFSDNPRFLLDMAKKYGLEINALTGNFAKFTAASQVSGMSMANQRKIFESGSRACTAFGMSADDSNGVFLALSQMMSKGKISSEELRLQMGERLPIALQAMAKAAGVPISELDKLMKQGKLMSKDVLPGFADALNEMIPNVDTDNLETSINRLKNAFTEFTNGTGIQSAYKGIIDWLTGAVDGLQGKISSAITFVIAMISGKLLASVVSYFGQFWKLIDTTISRSKTAEAQKLLLTQQRIEAEKVYMKTVNDYHKEINGRRLASDADLKKAEKSLNAASLAEKKAMLTAETAAEKAAAVSSSSVWGKTMNTLKLGLTQLGRALKGIFAATWPLILIAAISATIAKFKEMYDEAKRIKSIFSDYKKEAESVTNTSEISSLNAQLQIMNDKKRSLDDINNAQAQLQKMLGVEHTSQEELNKLVAKRVKLLENTAKADYYTRKKIEAQEQYNGLNDKHSKLKAKTMNGGFFTRLWNGTEVGDTRKEMDELLRIITDSSREIANATVDTNKLSTIDPPSGGTTDDKKTALQKAEEEYANKLKEYAYQRGNGALKEQEYNKAIDELNEATYKKIGGLLTPEKALQNETFTKAMIGTYNPRYDEKREKAAKELEKVQKEYGDSIALAKGKMDMGLLSQQGYNDALAEAAISATNSALAIDNIGKTADGFINEMLKEVDSHVAPAKMKQRDTTFDYKKSKVDIAGEVLDNAKDYAKQLQEQAKKAGKDLSDELANAMANVPTLEQALKVATVIEDVKKLREELNEGIYSGIKEVASSADRLVSSFQNLDEVFDPESEASGWERLMAVWSAMTNAVDAILSIAKMIETLTELTDKLALAQQAEAAINTATTATKITNIGTETAAEITALGTQTTAEAAASTTKATAASVEMAAKSTSAYAAIPFVGVGLAAAQIVAMQAMIAASAIPKFATGGIYMGGTATGDKGLARLNKGEMILNLGQQSRLFEAINSGRIGNDSASSLSVATKIRSKDLILIINNELKSQGKKPIS